MTTPDLLPCPFCGGNAFLDVSEEFPVVFCKSCDARSKLGDDEEDAVAAWNLRATPETPQSWDDVNGTKHVQFSGNQTALPPDVRALIEAVAQGPVPGQLMEPWIKHMMSRADAAMRGIGSA